jgi:hypothetical protein
MQIDRKFKTCLLEYSVTFCYVFGDLVCGCEANLTGNWPERHTDASGPVPMGIKQKSTHQSQ